MAIVVGNGHGDTCAVLRELRRWNFSQWGRWGKTSVQTFPTLFLNIFTDGAVTTETGSLFQYFTTLIGPWSTWQGCSPRPRRVGRRKSKFESTSKRRVNMQETQWRQLSPSIEGVWMIASSARSPCLANKVAKKSHPTLFSHVCVVTLAFISQIYYKLMVRATFFRMYLPVSLAGPGALTLAW